MLELEVVPERSLGCEQWEFILGMHFSQAVAIIQSQVGIIKGVQVLYSDTNPLGIDLIISLPQDGIRLIFDPVVQRLKIIEIYNMKLVKLKYCGLTFNSPEVLPSIEQIEHSFGATHPGVYDTEKQLFVLNFRGLSFCFPVESKFQLVADEKSQVMVVTVPQQLSMQTGPKDIVKRFFVTVATLTGASVRGPAWHGTNCGNPGYAHGLGSLQFPNGSSPVVSRTSVYTGNNLAESRSPALPLCCYHNHLYMERAEVLREHLHTTGIRLHLFTEGSSRLLEPRKQSLSCEVLFGDTCQDVATALGAPSRVFYKSEDKMKIHSPNAHRRVASRRSDFFYNYFTLGMDILFDAKTQKVKKFVLHTNFPGHYNFNMYHRCEFHLAVPPDLGRQPSSEAGQLIDVSPPGPIMISAYTKWDAISEQLKPSERPVVLNRASSTNTTNPFGSTFCYGYQDIIFEVMPNNYIASVTLYAGERSSPDV